MQPCCFVEASVLRTLANAICSVEKSQNCKCIQAPRRPCNVFNSFPDLSELAWWILMRGAQPTGQQRRFTLVEPTGICLDTRWFFLLLILAPSFASMFIKHCDLLVSWTTYLIVIVSNLWISEGLSIHIYIYIYAHECMYIYIYI